MRTPHHFLTQHTLALIVYSVAGGCSAPTGDTRVDDGPKRDATTSSAEALASGADAGPLVDLVPAALTFDADYFYVTVENRGAGTSDARFTVRLRNLATGQAYTTNPYDPFAVPPPGASFTTGGITRGLIGLATCVPDRWFDVEVSVDDGDTVWETNEANNTMRVRLRCPDGDDEDGAWCDGRGKNGHGEGAPRGRSHRGCPRRGAGQKSAPLACERSSTDE